MYVLLNLQSNGSLEKFLSLTYATKRWISKSHCSVTGDIKGSSSFRTSTQIESENIKKNIRGETLIIKRKVTSKLIHEELTKRVKVKFYCIR